MKFLFLFIGVVSKARSSCFRESQISKWKYSPDYIAGAQKPTQYNLICKFLFQDEENIYEA